MWRQHRSTFVGYLQKGNNARNSQVIVFALVLLQHQDGL